MRRLPIVLLAGLLVAPWGGAVRADSWVGPDVARIELPPEGPEWVRVDLPPALGGLPLQLCDATGAAVVHFVVGRREVPGVSVLRELARGETADGRVAVEVALPVGEEAPHRLVLPRAAAPVRVDVAGPSGEFLQLVEVDELAEGAGEPHLALPPLVGSRLRVTAQQLGLIRARWDAAPEPERAELAPEVVGRRLLSGAQEMLVDLRVASPEALVVRIELDGAVTQSPLVLDAGDPDAPPSGWSPLVFRADKDAPGRGTAVAPGGDSGRWLRVIARSDDPDSVGVSTITATARPHRVFLRHPGGAGAVTVRTTSASSTEPVLAASWDAGAPAGISAVPFAKPLGYGRRPPGKDAGKGGRPFPGAEVVATIVFFALAIWAFLLRRGS